MPDPSYDDERLAALYDPFESDRDDLDVYAAIVSEFGARSVLDIGCGTGTFACLLAGRGIDVVGVDPAGAELEIARAKPFGDAVRWIHGDATVLPPLTVDLATMTANVAQVFLTDESWAATLAAARRALRPGGRLVFETRDPDRRAWTEWTRERTYSEIEVAGEGVVSTWCEVTDVSGAYVSFRWTTHFAVDGSDVISDTTLRFRDRAEVEAALSAAGYAVDEVRDAPDRPGRELVFLARRR